MNLEQVSNLLDSPHTFVCSSLRELGVPGTYKGKVQSLTSWARFYVASPESCIPEGKGDKDGFVDSGLYNLEQHQYYLGCLKSV